MTFQQQPQQGQQQVQYQKNPNSGYLKPSSYGEGKITGVFEISADLVAELTRHINQFGTSYVRLNVSEQKAGRYGAYNRATANPLTDQQINNHLSARSQGAQAPAQQATPEMQTQPQIQQPPVQQAVQAQAPQQQVQSPMQNTVQQQPMLQAQANGIVTGFAEDEIPF